MAERGRIVVAGGGVGGLATALALGRAGWPVTIVERDVVPLAGDAEEAFTMERRGAPQALQTHGFLARLTLALRDRFPDVLDDLVAAGSRMIPLTRDLEGEVEGDEDLAVLIIRRTTLEWALRRAALGEPGVEMIGGVAVSGLIGERVDHCVPSVSGARLDDGSELAAHTVVACTGRRGEMAPLLGPLGVDVPEELHETGHVYLTRWYRFRGEVDLGAHPRLGGDLGWAKFLAIPGDGGTLSATIAVRTNDGELRTLLSDPERFDAALKMLPGPARLLETVAAEPIGGVRPMAGLVNRIRRFTDADAPRVLGFHAVGDAHTCTNPLYGRGCALAFVQANLLADAFALHPTDSAARSLAYEEASAREVEPWFHAAVQMDAYRPDEGGEGNSANPLARIMAAGANDPVVGRGIIRLFNMLTTPQDLFADSDFMSRVATILADPGEQPVAEGPTREEVLEAFAA